MDKAYVRQGRFGPSVDRQREAIMAAANVVEGDFYLDRLPESGPRMTRMSIASLVERARLLRDLQPGDRVVVAGMDRIGLSSNDIMTVIGKVVAAGAAVLAATTNEVIDRDTLSVAVFKAVEGANKALQQQRLGPAREALAVSSTKAVSPAKRGRRPALPPEKRAAAEIDWKQNRDLSQSDVGKLYGVSVKALRTAFGGRGIPQRRPRTGPKDRASDKGVPISRRNKDG